LNTLSFINFLISLIFTLCYSYQFLFIPLTLLLRNRKMPKTEAPLHRFAVLICARNEAAVIGDLIDSLKGQSYPAELITAFVMADNCTDNTAEIAAAHGAIVYTRRNAVQVGKGYALDSLLRHIHADYSEGFDGYFVFDADNLLAPNYIEEMNRSFSRGNDIITSYRNSKNYGDNWISAGYALWFLRESRYLSHARSLLGSSCCVGGTGFFFSRKIEEEMGGWPFHLLTEDIEFSIDQITRGRKIAFCPDAVLYDEQPVDFRQSWRQRMRWSRGYLQVVGAYGRDLLRGTLRGSFSCFDMTMTIMPAFVLSALSVFCNVVLGIQGALQGEDLMIAVRSVGELLFDMYSVLFVLGAITTATEWKRIYAPAGKKLLYMFTFPLFMFTYLPISIAALFFKTEWKPITHTRSLSTLQAGIPRLPKP